MCVVASHLAKFLKNLCLVLRRDPDPCVADRNFHRAISLPGVNSDPSALRGELYCVGKKVEKNLFDLALITDKIPKSLVNCNVEVDAVLGSPLANKGACVVDSQREVKRSNLQLHPPGLDFGEVQDLVDKRQQMAPRGENILRVL